MVGDSISESLCRLVRAGWLLTTKIGAPANYKYAGESYPMVYTHTHPSFVCMFTEHPGYIKDICEVMFSGKRHMTHEEFLASFLERMKTNEGAREFNLVKDKTGLAQHFADICFQYQVPYIDVCVLLGVYALHRARREEIVVVGVKVDEQPSSVIYKPLEERV